MVWLEEIKKRNAGLGRGAAGGFSGQRGQAACTRRLDVGSSAISVDEVEAES